MAFSIIQLTGEPIAIITVALPLDRHLASLRSIHVQLNHLAAEADGTVYFVFDVGDQEVGFSDILIGLDELDSDPSSWINLPGVRAGIAGTHPMLAIAQKRVEQHFRVQIRLYATLNDALAQIRDELASGDDEGD